MTALTHIARKPTRLAVFIGAFCGTIALPILAQDTASVAANTATQPASPSDSVNSKDTMTVIAKPEDNFRAGGDQLVPAYLDGQIANGGRVGFLGQQNARDVPFNVVSYTSRMIESQQAQTLGDVVKNDASVQSVRGYGNFA